MPTIKRKRRHAAAPSGFTLIEALAACVVLAILVLGMCATLGVSYQQDEVVRCNGYGVALARQLADEITSKPLAPAGATTITLGPGSLTSRSQYTCVANYHGYTDTSTAMPLLGGSTLDVTGGDVYQRAVTVTLGAKPSIDTASPSTDFAIVTVTVTTPLNQTVVISKFVPKYQIQR